MRRRLLIGGVGIVAVTLLLFALPLAVATHGRSIDAAVDDLASRMEQTATLIDERAGRCATVQVTLAELARDDVDVAVFDRAGRLRFAAGVGLADRGTPAAGDEVLTAAEGATGRRVTSGELLVAVPLSTSVCGEPLVLRGVADAAPARADARRATTLLLLAAAGALVLGAAAAVVFGRRLAQPLEALATSAERLGDGDVTARAPRSGLPETDAIADALDRTGARLGRAVDRGTAFAADAQHQLRTPLTALRLQLELLEVEHPAAAAAALAEADRLEATVAELVALTRLEPAEDDVDVAALVRSRGVTWERRADEVGRRLTVETAPVPTRRVRPAAVAQAVEVLVDNALSHGRGEVRVRVLPATPDRDEDVVRVVVDDDGPGVPTDAVDALRGRDGGALPLVGGRGLPLARALVEAEGGRLVLTAGSATVTLVLPADGSDA